MDVVLNAVRGAAAAPRLGGVVGQQLLGDDTLAWLLLAFGAAMVLGNLAAYVRPPGARRAERADGSEGGPPPRPPVGRTAAFVVLGAICTVWAAATLLAR